MSKYIDKDRVLEYIIFGVVGKDITCGELTRAIESIPTIEVSEKVEDERCKGCKHYKLACDLFSEICKYEPITQTETQNSNLTFEIADTPKAKVSEDCISREQVRAKLDYISYAEKDPISIAKRIVEDAPSVVSKERIEE